MMGLKPRGAGTWAATLIFTGLGVGLIAASLGLPSPRDSNDPGLAAMPQVVGVLLIVLAALNLSRPTAEDPLPGGWAAGRVGGVLIMLVAYSFLMPHVGFIASTTVFVAGVLVIGGVRRTWVLVSYAASLGLAVYFLFDQGLSVALPRGYVEIAFGF